MAFWTTNQKRKNFSFVSICHMSQDFATMKAAS
jgi:hypothetical protein